MKRGGEHELRGDELTSGSIEDGLPLDIDTELAQLLELDKRSETLNQLETVFGDRIFRYKQYVGTVREISACPAFGEQLQLGVEAAAEWLCCMMGRVKMIRKRIK